MSNKVNALKRIQRDVEKVAKEDDPGFAFSCDDDDMFTAKAFIRGPEGTIWDGGIFELDFKFSDKYPV